MAGAGTTRTTARHGDARAAAGNDAGLHLPDRRRRALLGCEHRAVPAPDVAAALSVRQGRQAGPEPPASLAKLPVYSKGNTQVTITLKPYKWSDGKPVTARDFTFLLNLLKANKKNWAAYLPGDIPDNVKRVKVVNDRKFTLVLDRAYSPIWFTGNQLSQLMPIPQHAWDKKSSSGADRQLGSDDRRRDRRLQLPDRRGQEAVELCVEPALAGRRRSLEAVRVPHGRLCQVRSEPELFGSREAEARRVRRAAVHHGAGRAQRAPLRSDRLRLPAAVGGRAGEGAPAAGIHVQAVDLLGHQLHALQLREPDDGADLQAALRAPGAADAHRPARAT